MPLSHASTASSLVPIVPPSELTGASLTPAMFTVTRLTSRSVAPEPWPPPGEPSSKPIASSTEAGGLSLLLV